MRLNFVGDFSLILGRIFVSSGVTAFALWFFKRDKNVQFYIVPTVITFIMSYLASGVFTSVYEMAIDSTFLCYMEDCERNDGEDHKRFADKEFSKLVENEESP